MNRRHLLKSGLATAALFQTPYISLAARHSEDKIVGQGAHKYRVDHTWFKLPDKFNFQTTHNVAVDSQGLVYLIHEGNGGMKQHPSIFVFDASGQFVRAFGEQFQGGGHGIEIRNENGEDFLYVCAYQSLKLFSKLTTKGEVLWTKHAPMESGLYAEGEDKKPTGKWGRDRFMPTNFAFLNDGGFLLADGYGAHVIHRYDKDANYVATMGKSGKGDGEFNLPHGVWIDRRNGEELVVVADRANRRLQWLTLDGKHVKTQNGFALPANLDTRGDLLLVPELEARVSLLDKDNKVVAKLGDDPEWLKQVQDRNLSLRRRPTGWKDGRFLHPHDACFDAEGNILVAEWVATGRLSRLTPVS